MRVCKEGQSERLMELELGEGCEISRWMERLVVVQKGSMSSDKICGS